MIWIYNKFLIIILNILSSQARITPFIFSNTVIYFLFDPCESRFQSLVIAIPRALGSSIRVIFQCTCNSTLKASLILFSQMDFKPLYQYFRYYIISSLFWDCNWRLSLLPFLRFQISSYRR